MVFTVLFDIKEEEKDELIRKIVDNTPVDDSLEVVKNYKRAFLQLSTGRYFDFFKFRKPFDKFIKFKLKGEVAHTKPFYTFKDGKYIITALRKCPLCNKTIPEDEIETHIKEELEKQNKVIVLLDGSIRKNDNRFEYESCTVKEIKKDLFNKTGVSVSKLEVYREDEPLSNNERLQNETVHVRQKRRTNR